MNKTCHNCKFDDDCDDADRDNGSSLFGGDCIWFKPKYKGEEMNIKRIGWKHLATMSYGGMKFAMSVSIDGEITLVSFEYFKGEVEFFSLPEDVAMTALAKSVVIDYIGVTNENQN